MQQLVDFFPLIAFFVAFKLGGIYVATGVLIVACALQIGWHYWRTKKVKTLHWVTGALVLVFGLATIVLHDARFIQLKLTVLMWLLAVAFLVGQFFGDRPLVRRYFEGVLDNTIDTVQPATWQRLNLAWVAFFAAVGGLNLFVANEFTLDTWTNFKVFGVPVLLFLFLVPQVFWLMPKGPPDEESAGSGNHDA